MSRNKQKKPLETGEVLCKGIRIQWKIFTSLFLVAMLILLILWSCQVLLINSFYQYVKTGELKRVTGEVIESIHEADRETAFEHIVLQGDVNVRILNMSDFENVFSGGDGLLSATHDIGDFEILRLYDLAVKNGGEVSQYYTYDRESKAFMKGFSREAEREAPNASERNDTEREADSEAEDSGRPEIGVQFFGVKPMLFMHNARYVNDFLYAKLVTLDDGTEYMVISDVQVTPLDSTIKILKTQLEVTSIIALLFTLIISYVIARNISRPIVQLNASALELARGKFDTVFSGKGYREIEQLSDTLNYTASELGRVEKFRRELLANVSHDLRTPLTMIGGYAEMMRDIPGENTPENLQVIMDETHRLTEFVNDILDLSKLQSGMEHLELETVNLTELLESIRARYVSLTKNDEYHIELQAEEEVSVRCDENKISQALYNLMDNAVNHTGADKTVILRQKVSERSVRLEISDSGDGISPDELPYIWDRYYRAEGAHKRSVVGSGIGLSIVKSIFEAHKLLYGVESTAGGTTFWVEFKRVKP